MLNEWCEPLMRCAEGLYILEEENHRIVWACDYLMQGIGADCIGEPCWKAFLGREMPCPFCPQLLEKEGVYMWDYYDPKWERWVKVKHLLFRHDGVLYRAGNVNMIDDMMQLSYETVQEIAMLQKTREKNKGKIEELEKLAIYDLLTGLYNRNCFHIDLEQEYADVSGLGVLYFDVNNLKEMNDQHRHEAGDVLLCRVADSIRCAIGHMKNAKGYRVGGDEFVLMMTGCTETELIQCEELFTAYLDAYNKTGIYPCKVAVGRTFSAEACDPEALVSRADNKMYLVKQNMKK